MLARMPRAPSYARVSLQSNNAPLRIVHVQGAKENQEEEEEEFIQNCTRVRRNS
jgi:hypothetical protein